MKVLHRATKSGRGGAVMAGFRQAMADDRYEWFGEMDADQSHQPEELPAFLEAIRDADLVVGARDIPGGRIEGWGPATGLEPDVEHHHLSRAGRAVDRLHERLPGLQPPRRRAPGQRRVARDRLHQPLGVGVRAAQGRHAHDAGPTVFINRRLGKSNMSASEAIGALRALLRMRGRRPKSV